MPSSTYLPATEGGLIKFANNFNAQLVATGPAGGYGIDLAQITGFTALLNTFLASYAVANDEQTRTKYNIQIKNDDKALLIDGPGGIRELVNIIQEFPGTIDADRVLLQITVRDTDPTNIPAPTTMPIVAITCTTGRSISYFVRDTDTPNQRAKPAGVTQASVLTHVGDIAPATLNDWTFSGTITRTDDNIFTFPPSVAAGAKVWLSVFWQNAKGQSGPLSTPMFTNISDAMEAAA